MLLPFSLNSFGIFLPILNKCFYSSIFHSRFFQSSLKSHLKVFQAVPHHISSPEVHQCCLMGVHQGQFTLLVRSRPPPLLQTPSPPPPVFIPSSPLRPSGGRSPVTINEASSLSERENRGGMGVNGGGAGGGGERQPSSSTGPQVDHRCGLIKPLEPLLLGTEWGGGKKADSVRFY